MFHIYLPKKARKRKMPNTLKISYALLDRDGVLIEDKGRIHKIEDLHILPNVIEGLRVISDLGIKFIVVTNQAGIAKGYFDHDDYDKFNSELIKRLFDEGITIEATYMCPHHPNHTGDCLCRKPNTGMAEQATKDFSISPQDTILVGDKDSDIEMGKRWGCRTFRIVNDKYEEKINADFRVKDLLEVANVIKQKLFA